LKQRNTPLSERESMSLALPLDDPTTSDKLRALESRVTVGSAIFVGWREIGNGRDFFSYGVTPLAQRLNRSCFMGLAFKIEPIPLISDVDGVIRIQGTRVTIDPVVSAFNQGATAEEIVHRYPSVSLENAYAVIAYYLQHRADVDAYVARRQQQTERIRAQNEARFPPNGIRERLLARRWRTNGTRDASAGR
jgi:uncharacterized protein (DUF433 family)